MEMGFKFQIVLADSLYGSGDFIEALNHNQLNFVVARSNHSVLPQGSRVRYTTWKSLTEFSRMEIQNRYIREIVLANGATSDIGRLPLTRSNFQRTLLGLL